MRNAETLGIPRADWRVADFGRLHTVLAGSQFNVILCNPPYLATAVCEGRTTAEGGLALSAGDDGLSAYRALAQSLRLCTPSLLAPGGALLLQVPASSRARAEVAAIFRGNNFFVEDNAVPDHRGVARCLVVTY
jgi:methylase of polypeptide subunit release factors